MKSKAMLVVAVSVSLAGVVFTTSHAQQVRNAKERHDDKKGIVAARAGVADDRHDLNRLSDLIMQWDDLRKSGNEAEAKVVEQKIALALRQDLKETRVQVQQADKEQRQSAAELRSSRREVQRERHDGDGSARQLRDDRHDRRDDRRDARDDAADARKAEEIFNRKKAIAADLVGLQKQMDAAGELGDKALEARQRSLLEEYLALSREEIKLGMREVVEDKKELREDRRETREDRRN